MIEFWDMHCHVVPGVDDGAKTPEISMKILKEEYKGGMRNAILTPHFRRGMFEKSRDDVEASFLKLKAMALEEMPDLELYLGCEFHVNLDMAESVESDPRYRMNGTSYVLAEFSEGDKSQYIFERCRDLIGAGFWPIIAHGERYEALHKDPHLIEEVRSIGAYLQINANSVIGEDGWNMKRWCAKVLKNYEIDFIGSDAHNLTDRKSHLVECARYLEKKAGGDYANAIMNVNPAKVCRDQEI